MFSDFRLVSLYHVIGRGREGNWLVKNVNKSNTELNLTRITYYAQRVKQLRNEALISRKGAISCKSKAKKRTLIKSFIIVQHEFKVLGVFFWGGGGFLFVLADVSKIVYIA